MCFIRLCLLVFFVMSAACAPRPESPEPDAGATPATGAAGFVGTWTLVSWTRTAADGATTHPYGEDAFGRIFYQANGKMAAILMRRGRPTRSPERRAELTAEERLARAQGFFAYSGSFAVDEERGTVTHRVDSCLNPDWVGRERVREFRRIGKDRIALRPVESAPAVELVWQREN